MKGRATCLFILYKEVTALKINDILNNVNARLAGELLSFDELKVHLDAVIDDINARLSSKFPAFSEFNAVDFPQYPNYDLFPDRFIRSVVCAGAAYKFYLTDEEGALTAEAYSYEYKDGLFIMQRDYSERVPEKYKDYEQGYLSDPASAGEYNLPQMIWGDL
jgi:hypothetical protein